ncbi:Dual specificity phosphatase, catalytic domain protein [Kalmanozyma brasiliensis GHG001]|uniref:Protein tyrosine phosphatase n=1 Tax=Kalmanozyma brasiliensis (strain GHG001) TaxID=1365824 RepID=V5ECV8_KALBG|nr:Dual specificity phosphatase, catalytic domain protein [Kalmanozyma brasiliensis GHG001]EST08286.1 Dual specificity phosphatase, catalytic domain protein [Kalmanozyma brasiliensis GHG001]
MAQPVVQQPTLSPPLSPSGPGLNSIVRSNSSDFAAKAVFFDNSDANKTLSNGVKKSLKEGNGSQAHRQKPRSRPSSSRVNGSTDLHHTGSNGTSSREQGVEAANHPTIAQAPGASFSVATKPQDRDPSLLRQPPQQKGFDCLSSYQLDHNGRIPASEYNYIQRDKLVASAQQSAIRSGNFHWVALMDLAHLASQHHMSPYSIMKFGPRGSPFAYIPITLQQPEVVENTRQRQREEELQAKAWFIAKRQKKLGLASVPMDSDDDLPVLSLPSDMFQAKPGANGSSPPPSVGTKRPASLSTPPGDRARSVLRTEPDQQVERSEAVEASSSPEEVNAPPSREVSSSEEDEVAPAKDQVDLSNFDRSTRMVELSSTPERAAASAAKTDAANGNGEVADELMTSSSAGSSVELGGPMDKERTMAQEMEHATSTDKPAQAKDASLGPLVHGDQNGNGVSHRATEEQQQQQQLAMKTSDTHPIHISPVLPDDLLADVGRRIRAQAEPQLLRLSSSEGNTSLTTGYFDDHPAAQVRGERLIRLRNMLDLTTVTSTDPSANYLSQSQLAEQASRETSLTLSSSEPSRGIGNFLLSSCPGKKVRLSGPVRGRGAICRDLGLDLGRIYSIGVRAVVCCLNDEELSYLGAPWGEYEREADRLGLDVYRLPMAEGFAPTNVEEMDAAMTSIVQDCTMRGTNVLVHCRGGVGRAGLIACSWLLKMGFVGDGSGRRGVLGEMDVDESGSAREIVERTTSATAHEGVVGNGEGPSEREQEEEADTILDTVRCLIETIRRRRSPKAIETAEQVRFLVEYVTYLHRQERLKAAAA